MYQPGPSREDPVATGQTGRRLRIAVVGGSLTEPTAAPLSLNAGFDNAVPNEAVLASARHGGALIGLEHSSLDINYQFGVEQDEFVEYDSETWRNA